MSDAILSAIDNPVVHSHGQPLTGLPFSITSGAREVMNKKENFIDGEMDFNFRPNASTGDGVQAQLQVVSQSYYRAGSWQKHHTFDYSPMFGEKKKHMPGPGKLVSMWANPIRMFCVMYMNYLLKYDPEFLSKYGTQQTCDRFLNDWGLIGVQKGGQYHADDPDRLIPAHVQTVFVAYRAAMFDLFAAAGSQSKGSAIREGDHVGFVMRRYCRKLNVEQYFSGKRQREDEEDVVYYWQLDPWVSPYHQSPDPAVYTYPGDEPDDPLSEKNLKTRWSGAYIPLGFVYEYNGNSERAGDYISLAREALYPTPTNHTGGYQAAYSKLPKIVIQLRL